MDRSGGPMRDQVRVARAQRGDGRPQPMGHRQRRGDLCQPVDRAPLKIGHEKHRQKAERRKHPGDNEHHPVGTLHRVQFLRALRGQGLLDAFQPDGQRFGPLGRGGIRLFPVVVNGQLH